jgi:hypothetical protein
MLGLDLTNGVAIAKKKKNLPQVFKDNVLHFALRTYIIAYLAIDIIF